MRLKSTTYKELVDTGSTHSYISKVFFDQIKELDYEIEKISSNKLIVADGQALKKFEK